MTSSTPITPTGAAAVFGDRLELAEAYVGLLADTGIEHGLIGPREAPRLWDRHVLNCAVVHPVFAQRARVADIGSGAGLPGIPLAIARPDLSLVLVEPLLRRTAWLATTVASLGLSNVEVHRGRAESLWDSDRFHHVTARAVARTGELARICVPLVRSRGSLVALKGESVIAELEEDGELLRSLGASRWDVCRFGAGLVDPETVVVRIHVDDAVDPLRESVPRGNRAARAGRARRDLRPEGPDRRRSGDR